MQKALLVASRSSLFSHFGPRYAVPAVSVKLPNPLSRVACGGLSTHASSDPKPETENGEEKLAESGGHPHTRQAYREDMSVSYGIAYSTRSSEEGYGERYGEAVKAVLEKKAENMEMQRGETAERDQTADSYVDYEKSQGSHVAQREDARHGEGGNTYEGEETAHKRTQELGNRGGGAT